MKKMLTILVGAILVSGCSFAQMPAPVDARTCSENPGPAGADTLVAAWFGGVILGEEIDAHSPKSDPNWNNQVAAVSAIAMTAFAASAIYGYTSANKCRELNK
jgi:hypothetical protein